jgi:hypothetical protein
LLPTVMRKKPLLAFDELKRAHDLRAKLLGRLQYAVGDEGKKHGSAVEAIRKCENVGRHVGVVAAAAAAAGDAISATTGARQRNSMLNIGD